MPRPEDRGRREAPASRRRAGRARAAAPGGKVSPAPRAASSIEDRLALLLDTPRLSRLVPRLSPETLHQLIRYRGLESCGEILAAATREQLSSLLDVDLWRKSQPSSDEQFDDHRFGEWLEALLENGEALAARIVSGLDERVVTAGLSSRIRVFDPVARTRPSSEDAMDKEPRAGLEARVGGYEIVARRADAWDAIVMLLVALEDQHREYFHAVMRGCRRLSNSIPEADGFHELLTEPEQLLHDLDLARQARRSRRGYLTAADARLVLAIARRRPSDGRDPSSSLRLVAADYLRADQEAGRISDQNRPPQEAETRPATEGQSLVRPGDEIRHVTDAVVELLAEATLAPRRPRRLLVAQAEDASPGDRLRVLLANLRRASEPSYEARSRELAFLANALMAGVAVQARPFTPQEASDAAVAACNLGLEEWLVGGRERESVGLASGDGVPALPETFLVDHDLFSVFQLGWAALHDMSLSAADRLIAVLNDVRCIDTETQVALHVLRRELVRQCRAGTPWRARDALDVIAVLDTPAWVSILGVLDECPVMPAALRATLERRTGAVSATAFEFISSRTQIAEIRAFMARLPDILLR